MSSSAPVDRAHDPDAPRLPGWWVAEVGLQRFKAAFQPVPVRLMPFTVIAGRNASGKSTLIEALQWLDAAVRRDVREASDRYYGVHDLINMRQRRQTPHFELMVRLRARGDAAPRLAYRLRIEQSAHGLGRVASERLVADGSEDRPLIWTEQDRLRLIRKRGAAPGASERDAVAMTIDRGDELALRYARHELRHLGLIDEFWARAVFLKLSPTRIADGSPPRRKSYDPMLDEDGHLLPALLGELRVEQLNLLVEQLAAFWPGIEGILVSSHASPGRDAPVYYSLHERMQLPSGGSLSLAPIPAWALSDGTRRLTAILSLLVHDPLPSLLCVEEIENGLDPWTLRALLAHLRKAVDRGVQVVVTTHSPAVLDLVPMDSIILARRGNGDLAYEHFASVPEIAAYDAAVPASVRFLERA